MDVWDDLLSALSGIGNWSALYFLASYLQTTEATRKHQCALYTLQAILSEVQLQTDPVLTDLETQNYEYRCEISLLLEQGKPLQIALHVPWVVMSTILCLETTFITAMDNLVTEKQNICYTAISKSLSFATISFGYLCNQLQYEESEVDNSEKDLVDVSIWITNFTLYLSEYILKLSYYNTDCEECCISSVPCQPKKITHTVTQDSQKEEDELQSNEPTVTQLSDVSVSDILSRCKNLYTVTESFRNLVLTRLHDIQLTPPLALQLMTHFFWTPDQSFEDGVHSIKEMYKRFQGLTAVSLSHGSTSDGIFISPEHLHQDQECSDCTACYNNDQLIAAQLICLKALQLLEVAPMMSARPTSIKRIQRIFLSSLRILETKKVSGEAESMLQRDNPPAILAELAGIHRGTPPQLITCLRFSFYRTILNYYCSTPQNDLYDIILSNLESISISDVDKIELANIHNTLSSINDYVIVLLETVDTCLKHIYISTREFNSSIQYVGLDIKFFAYVDSLYGLLICLPCRLNLFEDLIALTNSTTSLLYYYEEIILQNARKLTTLTHHLFLKIATQKLKRLIKELLKLYTLVLNLEYPVSYLETSRFQEYISHFIVRKLHKESRLDPQFIAKQAIQQAKALILNQCSDESKFSFATLAKKTSFMLLKTPNDASLHENFQCILFYLMMETPTCLFDYITTARIVHKLQSDISLTNDIDILISASKGLFSHINPETISNRFNIIDTDIKSKLHVTYFELLSAIVLCLQIFT